MIRVALFYICLSLVVGCASRSVYVPPESSQHPLTSLDPEYGLTPQKPVKLGGFMLGTEYEGRHKEYFEGLLGPNGERVQWRRLGSCCAFKDSSLAFGGGLLDVYELSYEGLAEPIHLYVNLYYFEKPMAPVGFTLE
ncbi:hypothetical protein ACFSJ3_03930 [Corallincola platygyrae]|uniref:2-dehydro-3-deoxyphosphooctonate aldolase n=1 Tax=Corallincola platygyrae TaxID=1193278 RepID=A0ABW4XHW8_9GAMM